MGQVQLIQSCAMCEATESEKDITWINPAGLSQIDHVQAAATGFVTSLNELCSSEMGIGDVDTHRRWQTTKRCGRGQSRSLLSQSEASLCNPKDEALFAAAQFGSLDAVHRALADGADVLATDSRGWTALHWAASQGHLEVLRDLLKCGSDPQAVNDDGHTPLEMAGLAAQDAQSMACVHHALLLLLGNIPAAEVLPREATGA